MKGKAGESSSILLFAFDFLSTQGHTIDEAGRLIEVFVNNSTILCLQYDAIITISMDAMSHGHLFMIELY